MVRSVGRSFAAAAVRVVEMAFAPSRRHKVVGGFLGAHSPAVVQQKRQEQQKQRLSRRGHGRPERLSRLSALLSPYEFRSSRDQKHNKTKE